MQAHFLKLWTTVNKPQLRTRKVLNYIEAWEKAAIKKKERVNNFRLKSKYVGLILHDTNRDDAREADENIYGEVRRVCAVIWVVGVGRGNASCYFANTELVRSVSEPQKEPQQEEDNHPPPCQERNRVLI